MTTELYTTIVTTGFIVSTAVAGGCIWHLLEQKRKRKQEKVMDYIKDICNRVDNRFNDIWGSIGKLTARLDNAGYQVTDITNDIAYMKDEIKEVNQRITDEVRDFSSAFEANDRELENFRNEVTDMVMRSIDDINTDIEQFKTQNQHEHITYHRDNRDDIEALYRYVDSVADDIRSEMSCKVKKTK